MSGIEVNLERPVMAGNCQMTFGDETGYPSSFASQVFFPFLPEQDWLQRKEEVATGEDQQATELHQVRLLRAAMPAWAGVKEIQGAAPRLFQRFLSAGPPGRTAWHARHRARHRPRPADCFRAAG